MPATTESAPSTSGLMLVLASKLLLHSGSGLVIRVLFCVGVLQMRVLPTIIAPNLEIVDQPRSIGATQDKHGRSTRQLVAPRRDDLSAVIGRELYRVD
jgi:hypothetical protein